MDNSDIPELSVGHDYVLFLEKVTEARRGGLSGFGTLYVPVSSVAGVFEVASADAVAEDPALASLSAGNTGAATRVNGRLSVPPAALLRLRAGGSTGS